MEVVSFVDLTSRAVRQIGLRDIYKRFEMPSIKERVKKALPSWLILILKYRRAHGVFPNLARPATFNEKILYRILFDRRLVLTQLADKAAVRPYVESLLGPQVLPKLYCLTTRPDTIPFDQLPDRFVVKPTHGSGWVQIVTDKSALDRGALVEICTRWLNQSYYEISREWVYKDIEPQIMVQEFIDDGSGYRPNDYRLFVFGGTVELVQVDVGHLTTGRARLYTPTWEKLAPELGGDVTKPAHLAEMIAAARILCGNLDFVRVDFYDTAQRLYFGELTTSPECATGRFLLEGLDRQLGGQWQVHL
jgi:TupA-like ATPgrasp